MTDTITDAIKGAPAVLFGLAGWSGSGKTTLAEQLITEWTARGLDVATIKHAHHEFEADTAGKDSWRHRKAGARQVLVSSAIRSAHFVEHKATEPELAQLLLPKKTKAITRRAESSVDRHPSRTSRATSSRSMRGPRTVGHKGAPSRSRP